MGLPLRRAILLMSRDRASMRRPFVEAENLNAYVHGENKDNKARISIGEAAKHMAYYEVQDNGRWNKLIEDSLASIESLTPSDIALLLNSLTRTRRRHEQLYSVLAGRICEIVSFFSSSHLAMILSAYAKADLMEDVLYNNIKEEIDGRIYEFTTATELCMILNAVARCRKRDEAFLKKLAKQINGHLVEFIPQELSLVASRYHALDLYDKELFSSIEERLKAQMGRYDLREAIEILAAYEHFDKHNKELRDLIFSHLKEEHVYLRGDVFVNMVEGSKLCDETKQELLALENSC